MAWVPKSEITSPSAAPQCGQRGAARGWGSGSGSCRIEPLLLKASQHPERALVDDTPTAAAPHRVPGRPVDLHRRGSRFQPLLQPVRQLRGPHRDGALTVQLCHVAVGWSEPLHRLPPGLDEGLLVYTRLQPAPTVQEVVALL